MPLDLETEAAAVLITAAFDGADKRERRELWSRLRAAVTAGRGVGWRPAEPWRQIMADLGDRTPRRMATRLGLRPDGTDQHTPETRQTALPWAWAAAQKDDAS